MELDLIVFYATYGSLITWSLTFIAIAVFIVQTQNIIVRLENITKSIDMAGVEVTDSIDEVTDSIDKAIAEIVTKNKNGLG